MPPESPPRKRSNDSSTVAVAGTTLETAVSQTNGGGLNSTLTVNGITTTTPLKAGDSVNVQVRFGVQETGNYEFRALLEALLGTSVVVNGPYQLLRGDVNQDRKVDVTDAVSAMRAITGIEPADDGVRFRGDVNADGSLDVSDVVVLLQWAVGIGIGQDLQSNLLTQTSTVR